MIDWLGPAIHGRGVSERPFSLESAGRTVPGILWSPSNMEGSRPLVLLGHGASLHKRATYILAMARRFVRHHGYCAVAIDGPEHGDRRADGGLDPMVVMHDFVHGWSREGLVDEMVEDWKATLDAAASLPGVDAERVGYWGVSMGTIFGLPFVVSEPRVNVVVLGLMGVFGPTAERLAADARRMTQPVVFLKQSADELVPPNAVERLFEEIASEEKSLHEHAGAHAEMPRAAYDLTEAFVAERLGGSLRGG